MSAGTILVEHSFVVDFLVFLDIDADFFSGDDAHYIFAGMADVVVDLWLQGQEWFAVLSCCPRLKCKLQSIFLVKVLSQVGFSPIICPIFLWRYFSGTSVK